MHREAFNWVTEKSLFLLFRVNRQNTNSLFKHWLFLLLPKQNQPPNNISKLKIFMFCTIGGKNHCWLVIVGLLGKRSKQKGILMHG